MMNRFDFRFQTGIIGNIFDSHYSGSTSDCSGGINERRGLIEMNSTVKLRSSNIRKRLRDSNEDGATSADVKFNAKTINNNVHKNARKQVKKAKLATARSNKLNDIREHFKTLSASPKSKNESAALCSSRSILKLKVKADGEPEASQKPATKMAAANASVSPSDFSTPAVDESTRFFNGESEYRRKFYIVQNGGSPAEMYCTDLVHQAKHGRNNRRRHVDERRLMKCTDKWREEWNHGVQMPLSRERPVYVFEPARPFPKVRRQEFNAPQKYAALNTTRYTKKCKAVIEMESRVPLFHYDVDSADEQWLASDEGRHVSKDAFLTAMNRLETDCYTNIHMTILEQLTFIRDSAKSDDDADCDICCMPEWEPGDEIVFCDDCNISVHQSCYGLDSLPTDAWMCATCLYRLSMSRSAKNIVPLPACIFCPLLGGAMKCTKNAKQWAHVVCALWIPEVRFGDVERREPISHVSDVPADRWKAKCVICDTCNGACIRCTQPDCNAPFHVSCAQRSGLVLQIEQCASATNGVQMTSYCPKHSSLSPIKSTSSTLSRRSSSNTFVNFDRKQLEEMKQNFSKQVDVAKISSSTSISPKVLDSIYSYWHWKRKTNSSKPLIAEPLDVKLAVQPVSSARASQLAAKARQKTNIFNSVPPDELLSGFERMRQLRLNLEKVRNLCYMVSRREKLKRAQMETFDRVTSTVGDLLLDPLIPCSKRRTEKLLDVWESTNKEILLNDDEFRTLSDHVDAATAGMKFAAPSERGNEPLTTVVGQRSCRKALFVDADRSQPAAAQQSASAVSLPSRRTDVDPYVFRSSSSPHLQADDFAKSSDDMDNGNVSDAASNYSEYSVAWSNASDNDGTRSLFNFENAISPRKAEKKTKKRLNGKTNGASPLNGVLKTKKVNFKEDHRRKSDGLNNWKNGTSNYVLHHPELRPIKTVPLKKGAKRNY